MKTHYVNGAKICKVYLTKESEERADADKFYTYGKVMKMTTESFETRDGLFIKEFLYLEPYDLEPEKIDCYRSTEQVELNGNFKIFKQ